MIAVHAGEGKWRSNGQKSNLLEHKTEEKFWKNGMHQSVVITVILVVVLNQVQMKETSPSLGLSIFPKELES